MQPSVQTAVSAKAVSASGSPAHSYAPLMHPAMRPDAGARSIRLLVRAQVVRASGFEPPTPAV